MPYDKIAQTFNPEMGLTDVWNDIDFYSEKRYPPTQNPLKLIERLIRASANEGDNVLDPFAGSGPTYIACQKLKRCPYVIEISGDYVQNSQLILICPAGKFLRLVSGCT